MLTLVALGGLTNGEVAGRLAPGPARSRPRSSGCWGGNLGAAESRRTGGNGGRCRLIVLPLPGGPIGNTSIAQAEIQQAAMTMARGTDPHCFGGGGLHPPPPLAPRHDRPVAGGSASSDGLELVRGASIAVREINERGGIDGRLIEHIVEKVDIFNGDSVTRAVARLASADVDAIQTNYVTAENPAALELVSRFGRPLLHTATLESQVELVRDEPERYGMIFQTCPSEENYRLGFVTFLRDLVHEGAVGSARPGRGQPRGRERDERDRERGARRTAVGGGMAARARPAGAGEGPPHWEDVADRILRHAPAVLFVSHFLPDVAELQRILASRRFRGLVYYVYAASIPPRFQKVAGRSAEGGIVWSSVTARYDDAMGERFQRQFMLRYGEAPAGRKRARPTTR